MTQSQALAIFLLSYVQLCFSAPENCGIASIVPGSLKSELGDGFVILTWVPAVNYTCVDRYQISVYLVLMEELQLLKELDVNSSNAQGVVVGELVNGQKYHFVVTAYNQFGSSKQEIQAVPGLVDGEEVLPQGDIVEDTTPAVNASIPDLKPVAVPVTKSKESEEMALSPNPHDFADLSPEPTPTPGPIPSASAYAYAHINIEGQISPGDSQENSKVPDSPDMNSVPDQPMFVYARCALQKCCINWRRSLLENVLADYYVIGKEYREGNSRFILGGSEIIDYSAGLVFAEGIPNNDHFYEACVQFEGLEMDTFYRFQVIGANQNCFGEPSRWSIAGKTKSEFFKDTIFANDCGCDKSSIDPPANFSLQEFQVTFPGYYHP
eukprot:TRINITY_DN1871_c1_g1_i1.p1 TRINITY_DN1871_c1_g1~~TRINITY_DN1871_c1_g1_i1.p1  ORF type:complete len:397 (-),score=34.57 TRINITY_DN1871_c1_g1_i1:436-1575(-)